VLHGADEVIDRVYFPLSGAASVVAETAEGDSVDVQLIGTEGMIGLPVFLGTHRLPMRAVAQVPGEVARIGADRFRDLLLLDGRLPALLMRYAQMVLVEISQTVLCNRAHPLRERTARWLLQIDERAREAPFELTQEFFATMLGVHRPAVTVVASELRAEGLIDYTRGTIEVLDRDGLEGAACSCYRIIRNELDRLLSVEAATARDRR
jgi:CRP-like cAMP-binding protein